MMNILEHKSKHSSVAIAVLMIFIGYMGYLSWTGHYTLFYTGVRSIIVAIHEGGHLFFGLFGFEFLKVAGGTIMQLAIPWMIGYSFYRQEEYLGVSLIIGWTGLNFFDIAPYVQDAIEGRLPLLMLFGKNMPVGHDWSYMLTHTNSLEYAHPVAQGLWALGLITIVISFLYSGLLIVNRWKKEY